MYHLGSHYKAFVKFNTGLFFKSVKTTQISSKSDKNIGQFTWDPRAFYTVYSNTRIWTKQGILTERIVAFPLATNSTFIMLMATQAFSLLLLFVLLNCTVENTLLRFHGNALNFYTHYLSSQQYRKTIKITLCCVLELLLFILLKSYRINCLHKGGFDINGYVDDIPTAAMVARTRQNVIRTLPILLAYSWSML
jgi:hypothetical protein